MIELTPIPHHYKISHAGYDENTRTLTARCRDGRTFEFSDVSLELYKRLLVEPSNVHDGYIVSREVDRRAKLITEDTLESPSGASVEENARRRDFGEHGSEIRIQYEELLRRRAALPVMTLARELDAIRTQLAAVQSACDVDEVERLQSKERALVAIIAAGTPELEQIDTQIVMLRQQREGAEARRAQQQAAKLQAFEQLRARLAAVNLILRDPQKPSYSHDELRAMIASNINVQGAREAAREVLKKERNDLEAKLGLPLTVDPQAQVAPKDNWFFRLRAHRESQAATE